MCHLRNKDRTCFLFHKISVNTFLHSAIIILPKAGPNDGPMRTPSFTQIYSNANLIYEPKDGVSMGTLLGSAFANIIIMDF